MTVEHSKVRQKSYYQSSFPYFCWQKVFHAMDREPFVKMFSFNCHISFTSQITYCMYIEISKCYFLLTLLFCRVSNWSEGTVLQLWTWLFASVAFQSLGCNTYKARVGIYSWFDEATACTPLILSARLLLRISLLPYRP